MNEQTLRLSQLSPTRQALVRYCQAINHGSIENLKVACGEPIFDGSPMMVKDVKLDTDAGPRPELAISDFALGDEVVRLMKQLDEVHDGDVRRIEVRGGIPRRLLVELQALGNAELPKDRRRGYPGRQR